MHTVDFLGASFTQRRKGWFPFEYIQKILIIQYIVVLADLELKQRLILKKDLLKSPGDYYNTPCLLLSKIAFQVLSKNVTTDLFVKHKKKSMY